MGAAGHVSSPYAHPFLAVLPEWVLIAGCCRPSAHQASEQRLALAAPSRTSKCTFRQPGLCRLHLGPGVSHCLVSSLNLQIECLYITFCPDSLLSPVRGLFQIAKCATIQGPFTFLKSRDSFSDSVHLIIQRLGENDRLV